MFKPSIQTILSEVEGVLERVDDAQVGALVNTITQSNRIVTAGAGRVGLATKGFAMRLAHLGLSAYSLGDMTVPSVKEGDLLLVASGSGETPTIAHLVDQAKKMGSVVALITANPHSRMGTAADVIVVLPAPSKNSPGVAPSKQPMTTLNEQCLQIFFDALVLWLMEKMGQDEKSMWNRHSNLE